MTVARSSRSRSGPADRGAVPPARSGRRRACARCGSWLVVALSILALTLGASARVLNTSRAAEQGRLATEADVVAAYVGKDLAGLRDVTAAWAQRPELVTALSGVRQGRLSGRSADEGMRLMASLRLARGSTGSAFVVDASGTSLALAPFQAGVLGSSFSDREWYRGAVASGKPYVSGAYRSVVPGHPWVIAAGAPVYAPTRGGVRGRLLGVVGSFVPLASLQDFTAAYHQQHRTDIALVSSNGAVLTGPYSGGTVPADGTSGQPGVPAVPHVAGLALGSFGGGAATGRSATAVLRLRGRHVLAARAGVAGLPYRVVAHRDESTALAGATALARSVRVAGGLLLLVLAGGAVLWRRTVGERRAAAEGEQRRIAALHRASPAGILELDLDLLVTGCNDAFLRLLGLERAAVVGRRKEELFHAESPSAEPGPLADLAAGGREDYSCHRLLRHDDGHAVPVQLDWGVVGAERDSQSSFVCVVTDVTAQHALRVELERTRERAEVLWRQAPIGVVEGSPDGVVLGANRAFSDLLGYEPGELVGMPAGLLAAPELAPEIAADVARLKGGASYVQERFYLAKDGRRVPVFTSATMLHDPDGNVERLVGFVVDLTTVHAQREALTQALEAVEQRSAALAEAQRLGRLGSFSVDVTTGAWSMSDQLYELWGHPVGRPTHAELREQIFEPSVDELEESFREALVCGGRVQRSLSVRHAVTGEERTIVSTTEVVLGPDGRPVTITGTHQDVTELTEAERSAREGRAFFEAALVASPDYTFVRDLQTGAVLYGTPGKDVLGLSSAQLQELRPEAVAALVHPDDVAGLRALDAESGTLADGEVASLQLRGRHADGSWRWLHRRVTPFRRDDDGRVTQVLGVARDVTELVEAEQRLAHAALHDTLTGLPNRRLLADRLGEALARSRDAGRDIAVLYLDLDGFKRVNDGSGHAAGDEVLTVTAERLRSVLRPQDTVARVGGDEFVVLVEATDRTPPDQAHPLGADRAAAHPPGRTPVAGGALADVARRIVDVVGEPVVVDGVRHVVTASVGIRCVSAGTGAEAETVEQVLADADAAMYEAKTRGKDGFVLFAPGLRTEGALRALVVHDHGVPAPRAAPRQAPAPPGGPGEGPAVGLGAPGAPLASTS